MPTLRVVEPFEEIVAAPAPAEAPHPREESPRSAPRAVAPARCARTTDLEVAAVYPRWMLGSPVYENAEARCPGCRPKLLTLQGADDIGTSGRGGVPREPDAWGADARREKRAMPKAIASDEQRRRRPPTAGSRRVGAAAARLLRGSSSPMRSGVASSLPLRNRAAGAPNAGHPSPPSGSQTRARALKRASGRCECTRGWGCH